MSTIRWFLSLFLLGLLFPLPIQAQLVINEFLPNPPSEENEWVEIFNPGEQTVDLATWSLADAVNPDKSLANLESVAAGGWVVYEFSGDGWLNNSSGDTVYLKNNGQVVDNFSYESDPGEGVSFGRFPDGANDWQVLAATSPGSANSPPVPTATPTPLPPTATPKPTSTPKPVSTSPTPTPRLVSPTPEVLAKTVVTTKAPTENPSEFNIQTELSQEASPTGEVLGEQTKRKKDLFPLIFIGGGIIFLSAALFLTRKELAKSAILILACQLWT